MTFYINSAEVIACALVLKMQYGYNAVSFEEVRDTAQTMRDNFIKYDVDGVVVDYLLNEAVSENPTWFEIIEVNSIPYIKCRDGATSSELEARFLNYIPISLKHYAMR